MSCVRCNESSLQKNKTQKLWNTKCECYNVTLTNDLGPFTYIKEIPNCIVLKAASFFQTKHTLIMIKEIILGLKMIVFLFVIFPHIRDFKRGLWNLTVRHFESPFCLACNQHHFYESQLIFSNPTHLNHLPRYATHLQKKTNWPH